MPTATLHGIATHYEVSGSGPPILMMAPGGFDSAIEKWSTTWPWQHFLPLQAFARSYTCIAYDRREAGLSGARVEQLTWRAYADQAKGLEELLALKMPALILPGHTDFHATSCARYLEECIPGAEYWDVHLESQPPDLIRDRILAFFAAHV